MALFGAMVLNGCGAAQTQESTTAMQEYGASTETAAGEVIFNSEDGGHAILADGEALTYALVSVEKTGDADGDEADFYGDNAAIFATNGGSLDLTDLSVNTDGKHANAVFAYGEGSVINIEDSIITTFGNCSGGLMTTGGATMNAKNLTIHTSGNSSAAIRSDRGGGIVTVNGGSYTTEGSGSPVIYSTAEITVSDAELTSYTSQGVVVEGQNSVTLKNVTLSADNNKKNSDKSEYYQAVMIYQSMSGDAEEGEAAFTMSGGSLTNANGDLFFVNNTVAKIALEDVELMNSSDGVFLRAAAAGWGSEGSNGGHVTLSAADQTIEGDFVVDDISTLNLYLTGNSTLQGAVNAEGSSGQIYVELDDEATWTLSGDSTITSLTCDADAIDLNGYTLTVGGISYVEGTASTGEAIVVERTGSGKESGSSGSGKGSGSSGSGKTGGSSGASSGQGKTGGDKPSGEKPGRK